MVVQYQCNVFIILTHSRCAGKELHIALAEADSEQAVAIADRFEQECIFLSKLRHPNIVLFLGVYFKEKAQLPSLVMELLPVSLDEALMKYPKIPPYIKNVILYDIACGLSYLHSQTPSIIHRDLSSRNVLLSENFRAKIADLGVAKIVCDKVLISPENQSKLTKIPGTPVFMPPEAFHDNPDYDQSLDMFSYGNIILNTVNQKWPFPSQQVTKDNVVVDEITRRKQHLDEMGEMHPLRKLTECCLQNEAARRPSAVDAVDELFQQIKKLPPPFADTLQMMQHVTTLSGEVSMREKTINTLQQENKALRQHESNSKTELEGLEMQVKSLTEDNEAKGKLLVNKDAEVKRLTSEKEMKDNAIRHKEDFIEALKRENTDLKSQMEVCN